MIGVRLSYEIVECGRVGLEEGEDGAVLGYLSARLFVGRLGGCVAPFAAFARCTRPPATPPAPAAATASTPASPSTSSLPTHRLPQRFFAFHLCFFFNFFYLKLQ